MSTPYRSGDRGRPEEVEGDGGLIDDIAKQFTDPMAFYRELVQNALDAGTTEIRVAIAYLSADGVAEVRVRDEGCGMNREVLQDQLLVLFRSSKEGRSDAIGKFGIGFISVLAVSPEVVVVTTSEGKGESFRASLFPDRTWEIRAGGDAPAGTTVNLRVPLAPDQLDDFVRRSRDALRLWCRHSAAPIYFGATRDGEPLGDELRIDEPLSIEAPFSVSVRRGQTAIAVGLADHGQPRGEFYNRGLLLKSLVGAEVEDLTRGQRWSFAVQDPDLEHTLSREDVRRDTAFVRVVEEVRRVATETLPERAVQKLAELAAAPSTENRRSYTKVLFGLKRSGLRYALDAVTVPTIGHRGEQTTQTAGELRRVRQVVFADSDEALHRVMRRQETALIDPDACGAGAPMRRAWANFLTTDLRLSQLGRASQFTLIARRARGDVSPAEGTLLEHVVEALSGSPRAIRGAGLTRLFGGGAQRLAVRADLDEGHTVEPAEELGTWPRLRLRKPTILLNADHALWRAATTADPLRGAMVLARALLTSFGPASDRDEAALTEHTARVFGELR